MWLKFKAEINLSPSNLENKSKYVLADIKEKKITFSDLYSLYKKKIKYYELKYEFFQILNLFFRMTAKYSGKVIRLRKKIQKEENKSFDRNQRVEKRKVF